MRRGYSRLASVEERKNMKKATTFIVLTMVTGLLLFFFGIPTLGKFAAFVSDLARSNKAITSQDKTPPAPPRFNEFSDFSNKNDVELSGTTEDGATVKLTFNGEESETLSDKDGKFMFNISLNNGENTFSAIALDPSGNISQKTQEYKITFDNKPPELTVDSPGDGSQFFGTKQRQVTIQGTTESSATININDRFVTVDSAGKFQYTLSLSPGENKFKIKATDPAENSTEKELTLSFSE